VTNCGESRRWGKSPHPFLHLNAKHFSHLLQRDECWPIKYAKYFSNQKETNSGIVAVAAQNKKKYTIKKKKKFTITAREKSVSND